MEAGKAATLEKWRGDAGVGREEVLRTEGVEGDGKGHEESRLEVSSRGREGEGKRAVRSHTI